MSQNDFKQRIDKLTKSLEEYWFSGIKEACGDDYKRSCSVFIRIQELIEAKISSIENDVDLEIDDTEIYEVYNPQFAVIFDFCDSIEQDESLELLEELNSLLVNNIIESMTNGLKNGTITQDDLEE